uniref:Amphiphysin n=1 Tax=Lygus hesperus TaxID=30085 RepID=A0A0A9WTK8_LYGHE
MGWAGCVVLPITKHRDAVAGPQSQTLRSSAPPTQHLLFTISRNEKKIDKRSRKLVDYDGQRHNMQSLEGGGGKKRDETKMQKVKEQLQMAKRTYDTLNSELHDDLPALHHSRILFFVNNLQTLFSAEQVFHSETSKVFAELEAIIDKLAMDTQKQSYSPRKITSSPTANNINAGSPGSPSSAGATTDNLPPGVLYKVKATYRYNREDVDELSFEVGDIIRVVTYEDPEEQEEGWLMGVKETTGEKGMFPANFTRPL